MQPTCPKCSQKLPEVETLEYRFCPHCGAEIAAEAVRFDDAYLTIPPDIPPPQADLRPRELGRQVEKKTGGEPLDDQTIEPHPIDPPSRPQIKAPDAPPPASFFRKPPERPDPLPHAEKKQAPTKNYNRVIIAVLVLLAVVILIMGGLFTF